MFLLVPVNHFILQWSKPNCGDIELHYVLKLIRTQASDNCVASIHLNKSRPQNCVLPWKIGQ